MPHKKFVVRMLLFVAFLMFGAVFSVSADGTETLGDPVGLVVEAGSGVVAAGTGLFDQPSTIDVNVPAGAIVKQVILYWEGHHKSANGDDEIIVSGNSVVGDLIGGPTVFFRLNREDILSSSYRADITDLGLVSAGANTLSVEGMEFDHTNNGAGVMVIYDDGTDSEILLRDGNDLAFVNFEPPLDTTEIQTFNFTPADEDRVADIAMFFSSVSGNATRVRPTVIEIIVDGNVIEIINELHDLDRPSWDTFTVPVNIPAGVSSLTVQALSEDRDNTGDLPASFAWIGATVSVPLPPPPPPPSGGEGCTPGYWKQDHHFDSWVGFSPDDDYETVFGVDASFSKTLLGALEQGGGGEKALGRHAVAALLNSTNPDVDYLFSTDEVIAMVQAAYDSGDFEGTKDLFVAENEQGCPLN